MTDKLFSLASIFLLTVLGVQAQPPQRFSYQAVLRDNANQPISNRTVRMRVSILTDSLTGTSAYTETHQGTTGATGILQIAIGGGTVVSGSFAAVPWGKGVLFIRTETDPSGGTNYTLTNTAQLLSVPYSLYTSDIPISKRGDTVFIGTSKLLVPGAVLIPGSMPANLANGLLAYYPFTGNAGDSSGNSNHGTVNGATPTADRLGRPGRAYLFNGINQNIVTPPILKGLAKFSISFWFRINGNWQDANTFGKFLFSMNYTPIPSFLGGDGVSIGRHPETNSMNLLFGIYVFTPGVGWKWVNSGITPAASTFYHVVGTYDGSLMRMYLNGTLVGTLPYSNALHQNTDRCYIGSSSWPNSNVNAVIDELRLYNRALTEAEIRYLYEN